ncbi:hypothetical protein V8C35DRAFT_316780 [Trichoderma chlorosporum]
MVEVFFLPLHIFISTLFASPSFASIPLKILGLDSTENIHKSGADTSIALPNLCAVETPAYSITALLGHNGMMYDPVSIFSGGDSSVILYTTLHPASNLGPITCGMNHALSNLETTTLDGD